MELARSASGLTPHPSPTASAPYVTIDKGIPIPPIQRGRKRGPNFLPWRHMQVGDSFVFPCPGGDPGAIAGRASSEAGRRMRAKFTSRSVVEDGVRVIRVWRVK